MTVLEGVGRHILAYGWKHLTHLEQMLRRRAEKAVERAHAKIERPVKESRKRVLRGRTAINLAKGAFGNLSMGREALEPYPQSRLNLATDTFLSAAKWLANAWEAYLNGDKHKPEFEREEKAYIDASETLAEMHLVVPKPKTMTGKNLLDERARLQKLEDFPDQSLKRSKRYEINPASLSKEAAHLCLTFC